MSVSVLEKNFVAIIAEEVKCGAHQVIAAAGLLAEGATNQEIAQELVISVNTAKKHVSNLRHKLGVRNRRQAVREGRKLGLIN